MTTMQKLPTLFLSHGSPMHAINAGKAGEVWASAGKAAAKSQGGTDGHGALGNNLPMLSGNAKPSK